MFYIANCTKINGLRPIEDPQCNNLGSELDHKNIKHGFKRNLDNFLIKIKNDLIFFFERGTRPRNKGKRIGVGEIELTTFNIL